uniref:HAT C-terminal dimerisation domain-containing protein n=2 Tax=Amphiprion ocellaris TaxID=80972 RepID=A0AAQ6A1P8_AMPOC
MPKRKSRLTTELLEQYSFLRKVSGNENAAFCSLCKSEFSVSHGGKADVQSHSKTSKHKRWEQAGSSSVSAFYGPAAAGDQELKRAAQEATFAYHLVRHNQSFRSMDCTAGLIRKFYDQRFTCARTKAEAIITNVIAPHAMDLLKEDIADASFISVAADTSNHKAVKLVPVVIRYFTLIRGVSVKILKFASLPGETSTLLFNEVQRSLSAFDLMDKVVGFCADNTNTNFGGKARRGQNNVFYKLDQATPCSLVGVGCAAHIVHNAVQSAADTLPCDIENFVVKVFGYFHIYTVRTEELKDFCDFVEVEHATLLGTSRTRWLSLGPAVERVLKLYPPLQSYFRSQDKAPNTILKFLEDQVCEAWLWFIHNQLTPFNDTIKKMEKEKSSAIHSAQHISSLLEKLMERKAALFMGLKVKSLLSGFPEHQVNVFKARVQNFYDCCISYLQEWGSPFRDLKCLSWTLLDHTPEWDEVESSLRYVSTKLPQTDISETELFDEVTSVKTYTSEKLEQWNTTSTTADERWAEMFRHFKQSHVPFKNISALCQFAMCLPGTNAPVERIFSIMNNTWTDERNCMSLDTLKALLIGLGLGLGLACGFRVRVWSAWQRPWNVKRLILCVFCVQNV